MRYFEDDSLGQIAVKRKAQQSSQESDMVADILGATGVQYRHRNSDVVTTSRIAGKVANDPSKVRPAFSHKMTPLSVSVVGMGK